MTAEEIYAELAQIRCEAEGVCAEQAEIKRELEAVRERALARQRRRDSLSLWFPVVADAAK